MYPIASSVEVSEDKDVIRQFWACAISASPSRVGFGEADLGHPFAVIGPAEIAEEDFIAS
jgi:hypothetical protein